MLLEQIKTSEDLEDGLILGAALHDACIGVEHTGHNSKHSDQLCPRRREEERGREWTMTQAWSMTDREEWTVLQKALRVRNVTLAGIKSLKCSKMH